MEVLVVTAIFMILLAGGVVSLAGLRSSRNLSAAADTVKIALEKSRLSSLVKEGGSGYGLKLNEVDVVLFQGAVYDPASAENKIIGLPAGTKILSVSLNGGGSVVSFNNLSGTTTPGTVVVALINDPQQTKTIYIDGSGRVLASSSATSGGGGGGGGGGVSQTTDTGHQDLDLGWSIQTTSELEIKYLSDPPDTNVFITEPHFNGDRSVFNFVGNFSGGGASQQIRIYSNQMSAGNTILSITREPANISVPLVISIDNRTIITYFGDGTMSVGAFGGTVVGQ